MIDAKRLEALSLQADAQIVVGVESFTLIELVNAYEAARVVAAKNRALNAYLEDGHSGLTIMRMKSELAVSTALLTSLFPEPTK